MKKFAVIFLVLTLALTACGNQTKVTIDIPADLEYTEAELIETIENKSDAKYTLIHNEDGSFVVELSQKQHEELLNDIVEKNVTAFAEVVEKYDFIKDISHNDDFTALTMVVEEEAYVENETNNMMAPMIVAFFNVSYQFFSGVEYEAIDFTIDFINADTDELIETYVFSEDF